jgi:hypothetical protein
MFTWVKEPRIDDFFKNAMLEFLWIHNELEIRSELIRSTFLWERWSERAHGACPFGLCLRSRDQSSVAFPHWDFCPPYLPAGSTIAVGENSSILTEPMLFQTPFGQRPDRFPQHKLQPIEHPIGYREITRVTVRSPARGRPSAAWQAVLDTGQVQLAFGPEFSIELGFDREVCRQRVDFHAGLPLVLCW